MSHLTHIKLSIVASVEYMVSYDYINSIWQIMYLMYVWLCKLNRRLNVLVGTINGLSVRIGTCRASTHPVYPKKGVGCDRVYWCGIGNFGKFKLSTLT